MQSTAEADGNVICRYSNLVHLPAFQAASSLLRLCFHRVYSYVFQFPGSLLDYVPEATSQKLTGRHSQP